MNVFIIQIDYMKVSCKRDVHICHINFAKKWNKICMKQLAGRKHIENDCFPRTLKFEMIFLLDGKDHLQMTTFYWPLIQVKLKRG
jgi:hypothetical protein